MPPGCAVFPATGYALCEPFLSYWRTNGGLERFGYPITYAYPEVVEGRVYTVQYFERRRMEIHPEFAGTPYEILLGLLGSEIAAQRLPSNAARPDPRLTHLLALASDATTGNLNLVRVGHTGAKPTIVNSDPRPGITPVEPLAWAPDGSAVAFIDGRAPQGVAILSEDGNTFRRIPVPVEPETSVSAVSWSPDGSQLLLGLGSLSSHPSGIVALLSLDGDLQIIGDGMLPQWAPDGSLILFERPGQTADRSQILVMRPDGGGVRAVAEGYTPRFSTRGEIAYVTPDGTITVTTTEGPHERCIAQGALPAWSSDGSKLAYVAPNGDIVVAYADGSDPRTVMHVGVDADARPTSRPVALYWSPDDAQLAFRFNERTRSTAGVINLDGNGLFWLSGAALPPRWVWWQAR